MCMMGCYGHNQEGQRLVKLVESVSERLEQMRCENILHYLESLQEFQKKRLIIDNRLQLLAGEFLSSLSDEKLLRLESAPLLARHAIDEKLAKLMNLTGEAFANAIVELETSFLPSLVTLN